MFPLTPQAQMGILQHQVELSQQQIDVASRSNLTFTSAGPVFSSVNTVPSTSQNTIPIHSVTQQSTTVHTPVTTVQCNSQQKLVCDISTDETSTLSQVHSYAPYKLASYLYINLRPCLHYNILWHKRLSHKKRHHFRAVYTCTWMQNYSNCFHHVIHFYCMRKIRWQWNKRRAILAIVKERICLNGQMMKQNFTERKVWL